MPKNIRIYVRHTISLTPEQYEFLKLKYEARDIKIPIEDFMIQYIVSAGSFIISKEIEVLLEKKTEEAR